MPQRTSKGSVTVLRVEATTSIANEEEETEVQETVMEVRVRGIVALQVSWCDSITKY